jgi:DNA-binding NtrC family response regulator
MIRALLIESDPRLRDIIEVGLETFQAFDIDRAKDASAIAMARERNYDLLLVNSDVEGRNDGLDIIRQVRENNQTVEILVMADGKGAKAMSKEKSALNIFSILNLPIDEQHFYKTVARAKDRIEAKQAAEKGQAEQRPH